MQEFKIWHATSAGAFFEIEQQHRVLAGTVMARDCDEAFTKSQNFGEHWNLDKPCRSTSVGDVTNTPMVISWCWAFVTSSLTSRVTANLKTCQN